MITAHLKGGLGNQMFQIATAYALALENNDKCAFYFGNPNINQGNTAKYYATNVYRKINELINDHVHLVNYIEPHFNYSQIPYRKDLVLQGFFQSEKYFEKHKAKVIELFKNEELIFKCTTEGFENSISIHVRRGDYVNDPFTAAFLPALPMEYYRRALTFIESKIQIERIFVFSDDMNWCKENFKDCRVMFVEGQPDYMDMYIMSKCENNIIANSSFSWWGAYLNENENKIVCAPEKWFGFAFKEDWQDIYCKKWIKL